MSATRVGMRAYDHVHGADPGASHITFNTMEAGLRTIDQHIDALAVLADKCPVGCPSIR